MSCLIPSQRGGADAHRNQPQPLWMDDRRPPDFLLCCAHNATQASVNSQHARFNWHLFRGDILIFPVVAQSMFNLKSSHHCDATGYCYTGSEMPAFSSATLSEPMTLVNGKIDSAPKT